MAPDLKLIIRLQDLDSRIRELQREIATLPRHISEIEKTLESHVRKLEADHAAIAANQRERRRLDEDIQDQERKASKFRDQMTGAKITNEQYRAFQKEIDYCQKEIRKAEDRILALMEESEPLERNMKTAEAALAEEKKKVAEESRLARARTSEDERQLKELLAERQSMVQELTPAVLGAYERIRGKRGGQAVAEAVDGRCSACHLALRPQLFQEVRTNQQVIFCESCGRILYFNPPVSFEDVAALQGGAGVQP
ncbi:MAG TPA: C4-type zinc ribbon domain-containing protein [Bryobacteraceae bacterium]|nr:C4-type zinc ribbon domain-containing protein [Bryobacteraceae bacterium]